MFNMIISNCFHFPANDITSFFMVGKNSIVGLVRGLSELRTPPANAENLEFELWTPYGMVWERTGELNVGL